MTLSEFLKSALFCQVMDVYFAKYYPEVHYKALQKEVCAQLRISSRTLCRYYEMFLFEELIAQLPGTGMGHRYQHYFLTQKGIKVLEHFKDYVSRSY